MNSKISLIAVFLSLSFMSCEKGFNSPEAVIFTAYNSIQTGDIVGLKESLDDVPGIWYRDRDGFEYFQNKLANVTNIKLNSHGLIRVETGLQGNEIARYFGYSVLAATRDHSEVTPLWDLEVRCINNEEKGLIGARHCTISKLIETSHNSTR